MATVPTAMTTTTTTEAEMLGATTRTPLAVGEDDGAVDDSDGDGGSGGGGDSDSGDDENSTGDSVGGDRQQLTK